MPDSKRNRIAGVLIAGAVVAILVVNLVYLVESTGTDVARFDPSVQSTPVDPVVAPALFPLLDPLTVSEFASVTFPMAESRQHEVFRGYHRYVIFGGRDDPRRDDPIGYVYEIQEDLRCPVCNNVRLLVALDADGEIREIQALEPLELSGDPMPVAEETRFFRQFTSDRNGPSNGPSNEPPYVLGENIDGITGATKSSVHIVDALNRLLFTHHG